MNASDQPVEVLCRYRLKPEVDHQFKQLLSAHWKKLHDLGFTTDEPARLTQARDQAGNVAYFESFSWKNIDAIQTAHETPEVMMAWEPMGALCDDMEFWHVQPIED